ncbi:nucleotidyltransferase domain-containing protein [Nocardia sp. 2]|uniref:Nucleotidyltransferase domain-containing protein n=1 Tax=Nocardia acididurans TaxID=2802282 RepID=A0ABS1M940_9NOCA|nr:nucleotidyltransferase domain-containing protein [Nocardia acididurans]MBL1077084.1 nucleotidyltransferase domain-containing protein [Nocardia acididurans]
MSDPKDLLLEGVVGSFAYGLNTADSDVDYLGVYVEPTRTFLGLHPPTRDRGTRHGRDGADATYHEVGKAMGLILSCNPTASEILWLENYTVTTDFGAELISLRSNFMTAERVRNSYFGYAMAQFRKMRNRRETVGLQDHRLAKHARHTMRLLWQGYELYTTGELRIRLPDPEPFFEFGRRMMTESGEAAAKALIDEYERKFDAATPALPKRPNEAPLEDFLQRVRRAHLD